MTQPVIHLFAISHFCEKSRWALDYLGIEYKLNYLMPGPHIKAVKSMGANNSSLPVLTVNGQCIQGSAKITDWAGMHAEAGPELLTPVHSEHECRAIEKRLDEVVGVHIRRQFYSEALVDYPATVRPIFSHDLPLLKKLALRLAWGEICKKMIHLMDLGPSQRLQSRAMVETELDWLDGLLADGRPFLAGDSFTRADLTAASLLSPLVAPANHPVYATLQMPPHFESDSVEWAERPVTRWVSRTYANYRNRNALAAT